MVTSMNTSTVEGVVTEGVEEELDCLQRSYEQYAAKQKQELRRKVELVTLPSSTD